MTGTGRAAAATRPQTMIDLRERLERGWSIDTTYCPESYVGADPAHGQCAVTSVLVQEHLGGELVRGWADVDGRAVRHYWNRIGGLDVDLTWRQFPAGTSLRDAEVTTFEVLVANRWMLERLERLRAAAGLDRWEGRAA